jgi:xylan 1,4-beta-xylosidase
MMKYITNPILRGFNPDPSIIRVGDDYYIATSTFEWFPGVQIHHSKDLVNWELVAHPLNRVSQLDMIGNPISGGIWAPCLSYDNGTYYLIYTDVKVHSSGYRDTHNYMVTTKDIISDWSEAVYLNSTGFDPSLFHDDDGRKWLINMITDHRKGKNSFGGIVIQEYYDKEKCLIGPIMNILPTQKNRIVEGPHIYKRNGYYYLILAVGGTGLKHAVEMARSKLLVGSYESDPQIQILTSKYDATLTLQKAGHADLVQTQDGEWYLVHLASRPIPSVGRCTLGRETCIQKVEWASDGWLRLENGGIAPKVKVPAPELPECRFIPTPVRDDFNSNKLSIHFQSLRVPLDEDSMSLRERPGFLRLKGGESLFSFHHQTLVARRQQAFSFTSETCIEFEPENFNQMAGLICLYDTMNYYYLRISYDEILGKTLNIISSRNAVYDEPLDKEVSIEGIERCYLRVSVDYDRLHFYYSKNGTEWMTLGPELDASTLSDEYCVKGCFTGAFVGLCCQDLSGGRKQADFDYFEYVERDTE